jgi:diamine N-acetyltransferase
MNHQERTIRLRAMEPEDLDMLYRIENDTEVWGVSATNVPYSRYALHDYIASSTGNIYTDQQVRLMLENDENQVVGIVDLVDFDAKNSRAEIGLIIERCYRRRGYAVQALEAIADYALRVLHLHELHAFVSVDNKPTLQLFRKMGYVESARVRDWLFDGRSYHDAVIMQIILTSLPSF